MSRNKSLRWGFIVRYGGKSVKYIIGDCSADELYIEIEDSCEEADGEFVFDTLKDAKQYCLERIDYEMKKLKEAKKRIVNTK